MSNPKSAAAVLAAVDQVMSRPFERGAADCCTSACDVFAALWGLDPMAAIRSQYTGLKGAAALIRANGGLPGMAESIAAQSGFTEGHAVGGLALSHDAQTLLVCIQPGQWAGKTQTGYAIVRQAGKGWHLA